MLASQDQVDKQGQALLKELSAVAARLDQERAQRAVVQAAVRESHAELQGRILSQVRYIEAKGLKNPPPGLFESFCE